MGPRTLGQRALARSLSDIAAMGATPRFCLLSLVLPDWTTEQWIADFYAELPITVKVTGTYHDMGAFASDVAQLPRIVTLNDIGIVNDKGTLVMDATAKTFRYLDEDEIAKQRKSAKDAKAKK